MSEKRSHRGALLALVLAASAAGVAGCAAHRTHPYAEFDPTTKGAFVIADDVVVPDPLPVSKEKKQMVHWASFPGTKLVITFIATPSPFPDLKCKDNVCKSGPIDKKAADNPYTYHAFVTGPASPYPAPPAEQKPSGDPTVIIEY